MKMTKRTLLATATLACLAGAAPAQAQHPSGRVLTMVVPYPPGGPSDYLARQVQPLLTQALGETMIIENIGGAGGTIGVRRALDRTPDGRTLLYATPMELVIAPLSFTSANFKPQDLRFIAHMSTSDVVLLTRKDLPASSVEDLIRLARATESKPLNYGTLGNGSLFHLIAERFSQLAGVKMDQIPYKGTAPMLQDLAGGQIDLVFAPLSGTLPGLIRDGRVKALGIASKTPNPLFPEIAPLALKPQLKELEFNTWSGIAIAQGVAPESIARLHEEANKALSAPQLRASIEAGGGRVPQPKSLAELDAMYRTEAARFQAIAKSIQLQPDR